MIHPDTKVDSVSKTVGLGIFATKPLRKGTIVWARDPLDVVIPLWQWASLPPIMQEKMGNYLYSAPGGYAMNWDHSRYMNHSCEPNCLGAVNFHIAVHDIAPGEELSDDYCCYTHKPFPSFDCSCGRVSCRSRIHPSDILRLGPEYDLLITEAARCADRVPQPLCSLLSDEGKSEIQKLRSNRACLYSQASHEGSSLFPSEERNT